MKIEQVINDLLSHEIDKFHAIRVLEEMMEESRTEMFVDEYSNTIDLINGHCETYYKLRSYKNETPFSIGDNVYVIKKQ